MRHCRFIFCGVVPGYPGTANIAAWDHATFPDPKHPKALHFMTMYVHTITQIFKNVNENEPTDHLEKKNV